ncbi:MAG: hypothetical protein ABIW79_00290 [Gemmatimonas sp.]
MSSKIEGDDALFPGQVVAQGAPVDLENVVTRKYGRGLRAYVKALDLNAAAPSDLAAITVISARYIPVRAYVYDPSGNMAAATLGIYTATGAGGTAVVTPVLLANLTGVDKFQELTIAVTSSLLVATTLYPRLTVASGVAGTASLVIELLDVDLH